MYGFDMFLFAVRKLQSVELLQNRAPDSMEYKAVVGNVAVLIDRAW